MFDSIEQDTTRRDRMLRAMAGLGMAKEWLAALLDLGEFSRDQCRFMAGPVIVHRSPWMANMPDWMIRQVGACRLDILLDEGAGETSCLVGPTEIAAVMYPATLEAPLTSAYCDLYLWASTNACSRHYGKPGGWSRWRAWWRGHGRPSNGTATGARSNSYPARKPRPVSLRICPDYSPAWT